MLLALLGCTGSTPSKTADTGSTTPTTNTTTSAPTTQGWMYEGDCPAPTPADEPYGCTAADYCATHADCTAGAHGTCTHYLAGTGCGCAYDDCQTSADCDAGQICACGLDSRFDLPNNHCIPGDCTTDADCPGEHCRSSSDGICGDYPETQPTVHGLYCSSSLDTCTTNLDCDPVNNVFCRWDGAKFACTQAIWTCQE